MVALDEGALGAALGKGASGAALGALQRRRRGRRWGGRSVDPLERPQLLVDS
jgi:hypothetical protein